MRKIISLISSMLFFMCLICFTGCKQNAGDSETEPKFIYYGYDDVTEGEWIMFAYMDDVCARSYDPDVYEDYYALDTECTQLVNWQLYMDKATCTLNTNGTIYIYEYEGEHYCIPEEIPDPEPGVVLADTVKGYVYTIDTEYDPEYFFDFNYHGKRYCLFDYSDTSLEGLDQDPGKYIIKDYSQYYEKGPFPLYNPEPGSYFGDKWWDADCMLKLPEGDLYISIMDGQP